MRFWTGLLIVVISVIFFPDEASAANWTKAFAGQNVTAVAVASGDPQRVAAVAGGVLKVTTDGAQWDSVPPPSFPRVLGFDRVYADTLYAGTDRGLYVSRNNGKSWSLLEQQLTARRIVVALTTTKDGVYAAMTNGSGSTTTVYQFNREGLITGSGVPGSNTGSLSYDHRSGRVYAGTNDGVAYSEGKSWISLPGAATFSQGVVARSPYVYQIASGGLYRLEGQQWKRLARPGDMDGKFMSGNIRLSGIGFYGDGVIYGVTDINTGFKSMNSFVTKPITEQLLKVNAATSEQDFTWVATDQGLLMTQQGRTQAVERPVLIIPGIMGSMTVPQALKPLYKANVSNNPEDDYRSTAVLDPINKTYDDLVENLETAGYIKGKTLFTFPYEWRQSNSVTAGQLKIKINDIKRTCACKQIDVVAHSMGGLVARMYIQSSEYESDVGSLVMLGTPNAGSLNAYPVWAKGKVGGEDMSGEIMKTIFEIEAYHRGYIDLTDYIHEKVPAVKELMPVFNYLNNAAYPIDHPRNVFLENLNSQAQLLSRIKLFLVGSSDFATASHYEVKQGEIVKTDTKPGDGTVLLESLTRIAGIDYLSRSDHGGMVGAGATSKFIQTVLQPGFTDLNSTISERINDYLMIYVKSPVRIKVIDDFGRIIDDSNLEIPNSYYSGSQAETQFLLIPNTLKDNFMVQLEGVDFGEYTIGTKIIKTSDSEAQKELIGFTAPGQTHSYIYDAEQGALVDTEKEKVALNSKPPSAEQVLAKLDLVNQQSDDSYISFVAATGGALGNDHYNASGYKPVLTRRRLNYGVLTLILALAVMARLVIRKLRL